MRDSVIRTVSDIVIVLSIILVIGFIIQTWIAHVN